MITGGWKLIPAYTGQRQRNTLVIYSFQSTRIRHLWTVLCSRTLRNAFCWGNKSDLFWLKRSILRVSEKKARCIHTETVTFLLCSFFLKWLNMIWSKVWNRLKEQFTPQLKVHIFPHTFGAFYQSKLFWCELPSSGRRDFCLLLNIMGVNGALNVVMSLSRNHDLVTENNPQTLFWAVSCTFFYLPELFS